MSSISCSKVSVYTVGGVIIQMIGLSLFVFGFFPVKPALSGISGPESYAEPKCDSVDNSSDTNLPPPQLKSLYQELSGIPPSFDRLILMVIDGLPAEFVLGKDGHPPPKALMEAMPFTHSLLANGAAIGFHAKAAPPTVTMPRLKAMVSGAIGGFLDVAFNFNTQAFSDDNIIGQFFRIGWKMVMHGDETWLKLFPGLFVRHDGVSSFFVKDTVQVDHNVSQHLGDELNRDDWHLLILHYLGLDHVGHIGGRKSVLMAPKLTEMDEVVKLIHLNAIQTEGNDRRRTLLMVVSDHGMTENGNHGGSSYEEADSLALFIGLRNNMSDYASATQNTAYQVDIAPTLAILFGVPIPKNNVGVVISKTIDSLKDDQQLRALELNSWQLLKLLQAQLPGLLCGNFSCDRFNNSQGSSTSECSGRTEKMLCCLYTTAADLHNCWRSKKISMDDYKVTAAAYYEFLETASEWLSRRATDRPVDLLVLGVAAMLLSCVILLTLLLCLSREVIHLEKKQLFSGTKKSTQRSGLDEIFVSGVILILVLSMGSSSMVEEEQYIWHFVTSTLYLLFLRKTMQSLAVGSMQSSLSFFKGQHRKSCYQTCSIFILLISGRNLRGWHQGGVNWTNLPDIAKWLEQAGSVYVNSIQLVSCILVISLAFFVLSLIGPKRKVVQAVGFSFLISGLLVLQHNMKYQDNVFASSNYGATLLAQIIYAVLAVTTIGTAVMSPWFMHYSDTCSIHNMFSSPSAMNIQNMFSLVELRHILYVIGWAYIFCWCLLQLLLQQPINSLPLFLLLVQILAIMLYCSFSGQHHKEWVEVAALFFLGMVGHFSLGNSNTLATVDVAGAYMGMSRHSTLLSGILMFIITYASPMLVLLSMVMYLSIKNTSYALIPSNAKSGHILKMTLGFPCLVPLGLNSIALTAYTIILLLMRNHLFIWSVFSPKYLYVCATTVCIYIGVSAVTATSVYTYLVLAIRRKIPIS
ncbi:LOW QUALITY PROTEIN: Phosphodiest domain-containing protein, partial [Cephalotus follicularis]